MLFDFGGYHSRILENKHTLTLGSWLFKIAPDLKQYVATKLALEKIYIIATRHNLIIALVAIDPHMVVIQVQLGKNIVEDVHGRSSTESESTLQGGQNCCDIVLFFRGSCLNFNCVIITNNFHNVFAYYDRSKPK